MSEFGKRLSRVKPGDDYKASAHNDIVDSVNRLAKVSMVGLSGALLPGGLLVSAQETERIFARITAVDGAGATTWQEVVPAASGSFADGPRSGSPSSDPAYEANGATPPTFPFIAILRRSPSSVAWVYFADACT